MKKRMYLTGKRFSRLIKYSKKAQKVVKAGGDELLNLSSNKLSIYSSTLQKNSRHPSTVPAAILLFYSCRYLSLAHKQSLVILN
jgi:hypothetical protein